MLKRKEELLKCCLTFQKLRILGIGAFKRESIHNESFLASRFSVIQVCLIVKLAYDVEPQLLRRSGRSKLTFEQSKYHGEDLITRSYYSPTSPCQHVSYMDTFVTKKKKFTGFVTAKSPQIPN